MAENQYIAPRELPEPQCVCDSIVKKGWHIEVARKACVGEALYRHEGKDYCVMHYPSQNKVEAFQIALRQKIEAEDFNFCGVYFPEAIDFSDYKRRGNEHFCFTSDADFSYATFSADASFSSATFSVVANFRSATFSADAYFNAITFFSYASFMLAAFSAKAYFTGASFSDYACFLFATFSADASFSSAMFSAGADFTSATFSAIADFHSAMFSAEASFTSATFSANAKFRYATFSGLTLFDDMSVVSTINFSNSQFSDYVKFKQKESEMFGADASLNFDSLRIEKPERLSFHSLRLRPRWFINTDPRKFEFIDVDWAEDLIKEREAGKNDRLLSIAYRQLAMNAEDNNRYGEAARFRYNSMDLRRLEKFGGWAFWTLDFWYWALSGYGERVTRAAIALFLILFLMCIPYQFVGFSSNKEEKVGAPIRGLSSVVYSLETASLQKPEPRPVTTAARFFVGMETILAPLQAALLALAIRRKYMR